MHAALGEQEAAVARMDRGYEERDPGLPFMKIFRLGPWWDAVLADPRVQAIARKMRLPDADCAVSGS